MQINQTTANLYSNVESFIQNQSTLTIFMQSIKESVVVYILSNNAEMRWIDADSHEEEKIWMPNLGKGAEFL